MIKDYPLPIIPIFVPWQIITYERMSELTDTPPKRILDSSDVEDLDPIDKPKLTNRNTEKTSRYVGVSWNENRGKWRSKYNQIIFGYFVDEDKANDAYIKGKDLTRRGKVSNLVKGDNNE